MDDKIRAILESIPKKRQRSKLEPYAELIEQLRLRGQPYREIAKILNEKCGLTVVSSTLVRFVAARSKEKQKRPKHVEVRKASRAAQATVRVNINPTVSVDDLRKRIEMLKRRPSKNEQPSKQFEYDPEQPLQLPRKE